MHKLYTNTIPFYKRNLSICGFWYPRSPRSNGPWILRDDCAKYGNFNIFNLTIMSINLSIDNFAHLLLVDKTLRATSVHKGYQLISSICNYKYNKLGVN